ncbi:hypothetical protein DLM45_06765 [Hyphomicrobium methylovorum]|uniref:hypothetical protein n=1 Tax=Hyphomicrobium methylovorum TaxID=84 RepID=UPI0015E66E31|nr:hypothetical protein [Hyphomicrobium methylovorum]MBA2125925.1 hypothetical protein [Hyphomicrobium methylovorum]
MEAVNNPFAFDAVLRQTAAAAARKFRSEEASRESAPPAASSNGSVAAFSVFAGLGVISAVIFATGYSALLSDTPAVWIHRLMALTVAQSIIIAAVAMKLLPLVERRHFSVRILSGTVPPTQRVLQQSAAFEQPPAPPVLPRQPMVGGTLSGREYLSYDDGSVEIDTLVGRRRFVSIEAAREFVGT